MCIKQMCPVSSTELNVVNVSYFSDEVMPAKKRRGLKKDD